MIDNRRYAEEDPRVATVLTDILALGYEVVSDRHFDGQTVYLDGRHFERCTFTNCDIIVRLGRFGLVDCVITGNRIEYTGIAEAVIQTHQIFATPQNSGLEN